MPDAQMTDAEKIDQLEKRVQILTEALQSTLRWKTATIGSDSPSRGGETVLVGKDKTREILKRLHGERSPS